MSSMVVARILGCLASVMVILWTIAEHEFNLTKEDFLWWCFIFVCGGLILGMVNFP